MAVVCTVGGLMAGRGRERDEWQLEDCFEQRRQESDSGNRS